MDWRIRRHRLGYLVMSRCQRPVEHAGTLL
jgi:hypothetical protein